MLIALIALVPSLFWLLIFWAAEKPGRRESSGPLAKAFVFGMFSGVLVVLVYNLLALVLPVPPTPGDMQSLDLVTLFLGLMLVVGPVEEGCKFIAARLAVYKEKTFDEPCDGVVFAAATALGFAFAEHLLYFNLVIPRYLANNVSVPTSIDPTLVLYAMIATRALSPPMHPLASVIWGAALGKKICIPGTSNSVLVRGLIGAAVLHGLFDFCLLGSKQVGWLMFGWVFLIGFAILNTRKYYRDLSGNPSAGAQRPSPISSLVPVSPPLPIPAPLRKREPLQLKYAFCAFLIAAATEVLGAFLFFQLGGTLEAMTDPSGRGFTSAALTATGVYTVIAVSGLFFAGLISGFASPGRTVREAAIGICLATLVTSLLEPWHQAPIDLAVGALVCTGIGTFGAWLGELLQPRKPAGT